jgi:hypothetical protein
MRIRRFTVILADLPEMTEEAANALYDAGCDDGSPGSCEGVSHVAFDREAASLEEAIRSAVADVRRAGYDVARIEMDREELEELLHVPASTKA